MSKFLRKNEVKYDTNKRLKNRNGDGHFVYVTVRHGKRSKINVITHAKRFFHEETVEFDHNPEINPRKKTTKKSRYSVPRWEENRFLVPSGKNRKWHVSNSDRKKIHKFNRKYKKEKKV